MSNTRSFERGLALYSGLLRENPELARELESSRIDFGPIPADPGERELYERRHLEWFLFDRHCEPLQGAPVEALFGLWQGRAASEEPAVLELGRAFLQSISGVFEVTASRAGAGVVVQDLLGLGTYEVEEREAAGELEPGDLIVGRLHPVEHDLHQFSPAAGAFRNPDLLDALRGDLQRMREARRGVLRIQQNELEKLFFSSESGIAAPASEAPARGPNFQEAQQRALEAMRAAGIAPDTCGEVLNAVGEALRVGDPSLTRDILDQLAFDTQVDLEELRRAFAEMSEAHQRRAETRVHVNSRPSAESRSVADALQDFDRGRAEGRDLEELFRALESDLGVEGDEDEAPTLEASVPGFPGVVGAVIEEFLWDVGREHGEEASRSMEPLRLLGRYAEKIDVFEELGQKDLLDFSARWLLDESGLDAQGARAVLQALEAFCSWCEEQHSHPLKTEFADCLEGLKSSVPRLVELRSHVEPGALSPGAFRVCELEAETARLERVGPPESSFEENHVQLSAAQRQGLRAEDVVCLSATEPPRLAKAYPSELEGLLRELLI